MSEQIINIAEKFKNDFFFYAENSLFINTKEGRLLPFELNKAQRYIHERLEAQLAETGKVRAIILKGRQQGCSTYVGGRFYWKTTHSFGKRVFILTHAQDATDNLFSMVDRYHKNCNPVCKQRTSIASSKELFFPEMDSGYKVGTAGSKAVGRSQTIHFLHGSEVAFWPNADEHFAGVVQAVPKMDNTEIILESTANGIGNKYHELWQEAERGDSEYQAIFVPWFWQDEYREKPPKDWQPAQESKEYAAAYGLDELQMKWMESKKIELGSEWLFKQEYPANATEAFQVSGEDCFITPQDVVVARKEQDISFFGAKVGGCDPARFGDDRTSFCFRQGRVVHEMKSYKNKDTMEVAGLCVNYIKQHNLDKLFVDVVGLGAGVYDRLKEMGYGNIVVAVNAASSPLDSDKYSNKRAEMWGVMKDWFKDTPCQIPNLDSLHADLTMPTYSFDSSGRLKLEKKEDMKKRGLKSPDEADALALTFAFPVAEKTMNAGWGNRPMVASSDYQIFAS